MSESLPVLVLADGGRPIQVVPGKMSIGRTPESDIYLNHEQVSRRHATIVHGDGHTHITDLGSSNGTFVNDSRIQGTVELRDGDRVRFARTELTFHAGRPFTPGQADPQPPAWVRESELAPAPARPPRLESVSAPSPGQVTRSPGVSPSAPSVGPSGPTAALEGSGRSAVLLAEAEVTMGRAAGNTLVLADSRVSIHHCKIVNVDGDFILMDLGSSNGTYVNGRRLAEPWELGPGDEIRIGDTSLVFRRLTPLKKRRPRGAPRTPGRRPGAPGPRT